MHLLQLTFATLFLHLVCGAAVNPGAPPTVPPGTIFCDIKQTGPPIVHSEINGLEVTTSTTQASLTAKGFNGGYKFDGGIGALGGCHAFYLNIIPSKNSYKQLLWQFDNKVTTTWTAGLGQQVTARATESYPATSRFLACGSTKGGWFLYLQTGKDQPPGVLCYETQLQVAKKVTTGP